MQATESMLGLVLVGGIICATRSGPLHAAATFTPLGDLPGGASYSAINYGGVSADGSVVVGDSNSSSGPEAFLWTAGGGMVGLGDLPGGVFESEANWVSADGSVIVGWGTSASGQTAFRWTSEAGMVSLGDLPGGIFQSDAHSVSADGLVVAGNSTSASGFEAIRWTEADGMVGLGDLPGGIFSSTAESISADGSVIVGVGNLDLPSLSTAEAFRWTAADGMVSLGDLPGGEFLSVADDVSADGSVIVGSGTSASGLEAFRWTAEGGMVGLGDLPGGRFQSDAFDVSADGSIIVGSSSSRAGSEAFLWTSGGGMVNLRQLLIAGGASGLTGWTLTQASAMSADGSTIAGVGRNPRGQTEAWVAIIPELPPPGDFDASGLVEQADLDLVLLNWGSELVNPGAVGWINDLPSGPVDQGELDKVLLNWGATSTGLSTTNVPEPASWALVGIGLLAAAWGRRRRLSSPIEQHQLHESPPSPFNSPPQGTHL